MSIISCTSPWPSARILPISSETRSPSGSFMSRRAWPRSRTTSPRFGGGTSRQLRKAAVAAVATRSYAAGLASITVAIGSPVVGLNDVSLWPSGSAIHPSGPVHAPGFRDSRESFERRDEGVTGNSLRYPVSGIRYPVSGIRCPVSGVRLPTPDCRLSYNRLMLPHDIDALIRGLHADPFAVLGP